MKRNLFLVFVFISQFLTAQDPTLSSTDSVLVAVNFFPNSHEIYNYFVVDYRKNYAMYLEKHANQKIYCEGQFKIEQIDSAIFYYDSISLFAVERDGTVNYETHKFPLAKQGAWSYYYENGVIQMSGNYTANKRMGEWRFYSPTGELDVIREYNMGEIIKDKVINYYTIPQK